MARTPPPAKFAQLEYEHVGGVVECAARFFEESEFSQFAVFSPTNMRDTLDHGLSLNILRGFVLLTGTSGAVAGFFIYAMEESYTERPVAQQWLFYVAPELRGTPAGRRLLALAEGDARDHGATVMFAGATAGIPAVAKTLPNLLIRAGYEPGFVARKVL